MRQVEMRTAQNGSQKAAAATQLIDVAESTSETAGSNLSAEEKKQLQRAVQKTEKQISEMETDLKKMEVKMGEPDFYSKPESNDFLQKYQVKKAELAKIYAEWEKAVEQLT